jgi:hypothetical protein
MTSIGLLGAFADVVVLLALAAALASPRVSLLARPVIATFAFMFAWVMTAMLAGLGAPGWTIIMAGTVIAVSIVMIAATLHRWTQDGEGGASGPGHRGGYGGGGPRRSRPDAPQHGDGGSEPSWWPEFEHQLALCVAGGESEKRQPAVPAAEPGTVTPSASRADSTAPAGARPGGR